MSLTNIFISIYQFNSWSRFRLTGTSCNFIKHFSNVNAYFHAKTMLFYRSFASSETDHDPPPSKVLDLPLYPLMYFRNISEFIQISCYLSFSTQKEFSSGPFSLLSYHFSKFVLAWNNSSAAVHKISYPLCGFSQKTVILPLSNFTTETEKYADFLFLNLLTSLQMKLNFFY